VVDVETADEKRNQEARQVYQIYVEDIRHAKNQLWLIIASGLSLQAALYEFFKDNSFILNFKYWIVVIATALLMFLLIVYWLILYRYRNKKNEVIELFSTEIKNILKKDDIILGKNPEIIFVIIFLIFLLAGACLILQDFPFIQVVFSISYINIFLLILIIAWDVMNAHKLLVDSLKEIVTSIEKSKK
jgi:hypothetical protein